jgi:hypothetical protein
MPPFSLPFTLLFSAPFSLRFMPLSFP